MAGLLVSAIEAKMINKLGSTGHIHAVSLLEEVHVVEPLLLAGGELRHHVHPHDLTEPLLD